MKKFICIARKKNIVDGGRKSEKIPNVGRLLDRRIIDALSGFEQGVA